VEEPPAWSAHLSMAAGLNSNLTLDAAGRYVVALVANNGVLASEPAYIRIDAM
jgi:hypothetical protein